MTISRWVIFAALAMACAPKEPPVPPAAPAPADRDAPSGPAGIAPRTPAPPAKDGTPTRGGAEEDDEKGGAPTGGRGRRPPPPAEPIVAPAPGVAPGAPKPPIAAPEGIIQVNSREWTISQELLDDWKGSPGMLGKVRQVEGGWELFGIRQRAGYSLGMRNGDVIKTVNGHQLETKMQQLGAWFDLRNDETFNVVFLRGGSQYSYTYRAVE